MNLGTVKTVLSKEISINSFLFALLVLAIPMFAYYSYFTKEYNPIEETVNVYYKVYQQRTDWPGFLNFYAEDVVLLDYVGGYKIEGKTTFAQFFNWPDPRFKKGAINALEITSQTISKNTVTTQGFFTPFTWGDIEVEAMQFTTILEFNADGKIVKHIDWINYPDYLIDYKTRVNSNDWIE